MAENTANDAHIRTVLENWAQAIRDKDMDKILAQHTDDILMFDVPLPIQSQGMDEYRKTWELFFEYSPGGDGTFNFKSLRIIAGDTVAFAHTLLEVAGDTARLTIGLQKVGDQWLIAHEHHSFPSTGDE